MPQESTPLQFHEYFSRIPVPKTLEGKILDGSDGEPRGFIENLSKINVFVGPNNSGKSYILREVLKSNIAPQSIPEYARKEISNKIEEMRLHLQSKFGISPLVDKIGFPFDTDGGMSEVAHFKTVLRVFTSSQYTPEATDYQDLQNKLSFYERVANGSVDLIETGELERESTIEEYRLLVRHFADLRRLILSFIKEVRSKYTLSARDSAAKIYIHQHRSLLNHISVSRRIDNSPSSESVDRALILELRDQYFAKSDIFPYSPAVSDTYRHFKPHILFLDGEDLVCKVLHLETGIKVYSDIFHLAINDRRALTRYEDFLSAEFFESKLVTLFPTNEGDSNLKIQIGDEETLPIYKLGTGIQMIISLTLPLFLYDAGIVVVEEPELFVHPGLQKQLMKIYSSHSVAKNFQFFIATHSNHILDATLYDNNVSTFRVEKRFEEEQKDTKFVLHTLAYGDENALSSLGVSNSSVFLANCTIWVEGVTDRLYLAKYIEEYARKFPERFKKYKEGVHYSFVYSGGNTIIYWDFRNLSPEELDDLKKEVSAKYLCGRAMVIVDKDSIEPEVAGDSAADHGASSPEAEPDEQLSRKKIQRTELKEILKNDFLELPLVEVENLLPLEIICKVIKKNYPTWKDWAIPQSKTELTELNKHLKNTRLKSFISSHLLPTYTNAPAKVKFKMVQPSARPGGDTLDSSDKVKFAETAKNLITFDNMTAEAKDLAEKVLEFIERHNY